jgi:hypothetical protein
MAGLSCLEWFRSLSRDRLFVLSADKGFFTENTLLDYTLPGIAHHGSFSLMVNYHAFGVYAQLQGGEPWFRHRNGSSITVCAFDLTGDTELWETRQAWESAGLNYGPDDFFQLKGGMERNFGHFKGNELLAYVRMTGYDPKALQRILPFLTAEAEAYKMTWAADFMELLPKVMANYFCIGEDYDMSAETENLVRLLRGE